MPNPQNSAPALLNAAKLPLKGHLSYWNCRNTTETALAVISKAQKHPGLVIFLTKNMADANLYQSLFEFFSDDRLPILTFPEWETLPYDHFSPHQDIISQRLTTLYHLPSLPKGVLILPISTLIQKVVPHPFIEKYTFLLAKGDVIDMEAFCQQLENGSYKRVSQVMEHGEFAIRGSIIDLFPIGSQKPYRLDLFDNEIDSLRSFDPETQRSIDTIESIKLLPAKEYDLTADGITLFRQNARKHFGETVRNTQLYESVTQNQTLDGLEYYLSLFHADVATLFDYFPENSLFFSNTDINTGIQHTWQDYQERFDIARHNPDYPLLQPQELILNERDVFSELRGFHRIQLQAESDDNKGVQFDTQSLPDLTIQANSDYPFAKLIAFIDQYQTSASTRILYCAESTGRRETLLSLFSNTPQLKEKLPKQIESWSEFIHSELPFQIIVGPLEESLATPEFCILSETQIFGQTVIQKRRRKRKHSEFENGISNLVELEVGDPVVHFDHGVGRYLGLETLSLQNEETEFLMIQYANEAKLYVPVTSLHLISRYTGANAETAPLHKLGSDKWEKAKRKAAEKAHDVAAELLDIYAQREAKPGFSFIADEDAYTRFAAHFPFEETPDQEAAIEAVLEDMRLPKPMDRLICGDVGFGKTEVAMRAAFVAAMAGKQVAVLVPTTLLAEQHFQSFSDRFADWPIRIAELSRFRSGKEVTQVLKDLADGRLDIVIGTHKLIQKDVKFHNLGLVILDEEHRFGVQQKERLKALRAEVDVLTLTATPIPRTLAMSLEGLRDFSVIATAPQRRLSIKTFVSNFSQGVIREAVLRELKRGGQVYFLHNEVDTIANMLEKLETLLPEARIRVAHGQMGERDLEAVMRDFHHQRFNVLLCTTIIETGIDVPTANTIIINRADRFGLAQLHQLRGRVGRSHHQAYAYLLVDSLDGLTAQAKKRLEAIQAMEQLGSGFFLAMHDLEIRGAGEVLGESQSGEMQEIGFSLYNDMLNAAITSLKAGHEPDMAHPLGVTTEINLHTPALLPNDYCGDIHQRLVIYKRLAHCNTQQDLDDMQQELIDRFGLLPEPAQTLLDSHRLRILAKPLGISKVDASSEAIVIQFVPNPPIDPMKIITLIQSKRHIKMAGQDKLKIDLKYGDLQQRALAVVNFFKELG